MDWARILAFVTGMVDQELLARIEYLAAENRILKAQLKGRLRLSDAERATLGEIGHRLGRKVLCEVANVALSFPKIQSGRIRAVRQNQRIIQCDVCDHPPTCNVHSRSVQAATSA